MELYSAPPFFDENCEILSLSAPFALWNFPLNMPLPLKIVQQPIWAEEKIIERVRGGPIRHDHE